MLRRTLFAAGLTLLASLLAAGFAMNYQPDRGAVSAATATTVVAPPAFAGCSIPVTITEMKIVKRGPRSDSFLQIKASAKPPAGVGLDKATVLIRVISGGKVEKVSKEIDLLSSGSAIVVEQPITAALDRLGSLPTKIEADLFVDGKVSGRATQSVVP